MKIVVEVRGHQFVLRLHHYDPEPFSEPDPSPSRDISSVPSAQVEQASDGVYGPFGFAPVIKAERRG